MGGCSRNTYLGKAPAFKGRPLTAASPYSCRRRAAKKVAFIVFVVYGLVILQEQGGYQTL